MREPVPRAIGVPFAPFEWPVGRIRSLAPRWEPLEIDLVQLLGERRTRREFRSTVPPASLADFLWLACRNRSSRGGEFGLQESRVHPSAGAMHPVHVLVAGQQCWDRYDATGHALQEIVGSELSLEAARSRAGELVEVDRGLVLGLVLEPGKSAAKYIHEETLIWRDAGVVLGYMSLVAEALALSFCPLGIADHPRFEDAGNRLLPGGLAVLGLAS